MEALILFFILAFSEQNLPLSTARNSKHTYMVMASTRNMSQAAWKEDGHPVGNMRMLSKVDKRAD